MSRVDDGNDERRRAEIRAAEKKLLLKSAEKRATEKAAFDQALARKADEGRPRGSDRAADAAAARRSETLKEDHAARTEPELPAQVSSDDVTLHEHLGKEVLRRVRQNAERSTTERMPTERVEVREKEDWIQDQRRDAREHVEANEARAAERAGKSAGGTKGPGGRVEREKDGKGGGQGGQGGKDDKPDGQFKVPPPALMAPPPVARPKDSPASSRLRALAQEIVNRIVERVRVGSNKAGLPEFQIELRSTVLAGLLIKVSSNKGRIRATFCGRDREVLKGIKLASGELKQALEARGIPLEQLDFEEV